METTTRHIGRQIAAARALRGLKGNVLAEKMGITRQGLYAIEKAESVTTATLSKVADALGMTPGEIIDLGVKDEVRA